MDNSLDRSRDVSPGEPAEPTSLALRSGGTLTVENGVQGETIVLRSGGGAVQLVIRMTEQGPVLTLTGVRFELAATDTVAVKCREFAVETTDGIRLAAGGDLSVSGGGEMRIKSGKSTYLDGDYLHLNCQDRAGYHDEAGGDSSDKTGGQG